MVKALETIHHRGGLCFPGELYDGPGQDELVERGVAEFVDTSSGPAVEPMPQVEPSGAPTEELVHIPIESDDSGDSGDAQPSSGRKRK